MCYVSSDGHPLVEVDTDNRTVVLLFGRRISVESY